jgi:DNA-binding transcriptional MocR family regulator
LLRRCAGCGVLDSGGGVNHLTAMVLAELLGAGFLDAHVAGLRAALGARRDVLIEALAQQLPADCSWSAVRGGYFVLLQLPAGFDAAKLLPYAEQAGVAFLPGSRFFVGEGGAECLRLSFSLLLPDELQEGARRLGAVLHSARPSRL